ncbi:MAG: hypothetical protein LBG86_00445 [Puniceicoccales bacterium]|jgi:hypothetical protein|nr:hypothetical protein [Puniceicoccales bacterium]
MFRASQLDRTPHRRRCVDGIDDSEWITTLPLLVSVIFAAAHAFLLLFIYSAQKAMFIMLFTTCNYIAFFSIFAIRHVMQRYSLGP